jgi:hypothetical protein
LVDRRASKGEAFVATTAPTTPQVEAILWRYTWATPTRRQVSLAASPSTPSGTSATSSSPTARKPADYDPAAFQGIHARYVLVIIDEAGGIPKSIFDAVDALATNIDARVVAVGNPDDPASHFATICKPGSGWHVETISAFDTPAYTGEKVPEELLPLLVSPEWVEERKLRWGHQQPDLPVEAPGGRLDTDVPRPSQGRHDDHDWHIVNAMREIDAEEGKNDWVRAVVDDPGVGGGVVDRLAELNLPVTPYNVARHRSTKSGSSTLERRTTGNCASGSNRRDRHRPG